MRTRQIEKMVANKDRLSYSQKRELAEGILNNKKARETAIIGALFQDNLALAIELMIYKKEQK